jgi:hypothetical protein
VVLPPTYTFGPGDGGQVYFPGGATLYTPGNQLLTAIDSAHSFTASATVNVAGGTLPNLSQPGRGVTLVMPGTPDQVLAPVALPDPAGTVGSTPSPTSPALDSLFAAAVSPAGAAPGFIVDTNGLTPVGLTDPLTS